MTLSNKLITITFLLNAIIPIHTFVTPQTTFNRIKLKNLQTLQYQEEEVPCEAEICVTDVDLPPDYAAAREKVMDILRRTGKLHPKQEFLVMNFMTEYFVAVAENPNVQARVAAAKFLKVVQLTDKYGLGRIKYDFGLHHAALRGGEEKNPEGNFDFYRFGRDFTNFLVNHDASVILGEVNIKKAFQQIKDGENVVFLANHQSEADPLVLSLLLEKIGFGKEAEDIVYVAGHKVITDPIGIPFSMGTNLLCIHSKKHIESEPELRVKKTGQNLKTMNAMLHMMKQGGVCLWVAPSGGRDRREVETNKVPLAKFDYKTIDMFRVMGERSGVPIHFYPLSMVTYDLCPPPDFVDSGVNEQRVFHYSPVGLAVGEEIYNVLGGFQTRRLFNQYAEGGCRLGYEALLTAIEEKMQK